MGLEASDWGGPRWDFNLAALTWMAPPWHPGLGKGGLADLAIVGLGDGEGTLPRSLKMVPTSPSLHPLGLC